MSEEPENHACQATPREELRRQIMDCNVPKNEREWWAAREIESLRKYKQRLEWLHTGGDRDAEGLEWGIYRVKWDRNGQPVEVHATLSDFSDLDAEMRRTNPEKD